MQIRLSGVNAMFFVETVSLENRLDVARINRDRFGISRATTDGIPSNRSFAGCELDTQCHAALLAANSPTPSAADWLSTSRRTVCRKFGLVFPPTGYRITGVGTPTRCRCRICGGACENLSVPGREQRPCILTPLIHL